MNYYKLKYANGDGKYVKRWLQTADGRVWLTSPRGGYRLVGEKTPPKGWLIK